MKYFKQSEHKFKLKMPPSFILFEKYPSGIGIDFVIIKKIILWGAFETNKMMVFQYIFYARLTFSISLKKVSLFQEVFLINIFAKILLCSSVFLKFQGGLFSDYRGWSM